MKIKDVCHIIILVLLGIWGLNNIFFIYQTRQNCKSVANAHKEYADNIKTQVYLMTSDQVSSLFQYNTNEIPEHWEYNNPSLKMSDIAKYGILDAYGGPLFLVVRVKNEGPNIAWGRIQCHMPSGRSIRNVQILPLKTEMPYFVNYVINGYFHGFWPQNLGAPNILVSWEELYLQE